jgi:hypothetical protein
MFIKSISDYYYTPDQFEIESLNKFLLTGKKNKYVQKLKKKIIFKLEKCGSIIIKNFVITKNNKKNKNNFKKFSSLLGLVHKQNKAGEKIVTIEDRKVGKWSAKIRGYKTNDALDLHTDGGSIALLFCIRSSISGGKSIFLFAKNILSKIKNKEYKKILFSGYNYHTRFESKDSSVVTKKKYPIFFLKQKKIHCMYNRKPIYEAMKHLNNFTNLDALNYFNKIIISLKKKIFSFKLKPGEIWIVNNFMLLHGRKNFKDNKQSKRLLLRSWVTPKNFSYSGNTILDAYNNR